LIFVRKEYKIIKIIDEYRVLINAGSNDDLSIGQHLEVFKLGQEIFDPETNESLGTLDSIKSNLVVTTVYEKMCICENRNKANPFDGLSAVFGNSRSRLPVDPTSITGGLSDDDKIVIGDLVRKSL
jgi:hypothetical protein